MHALFFFFFASPWNPIPTFLPVLIYNCSSTTSSLFIFIIFNIFLLCNLQYYLCASCGLFVIFFFSWLLWDFSLFFPRICYFPFLILLISTFILSLVSNNIIFPFIFSVFLCICSFFVFVLFVLSFI